ncbi:MAG: nucleoside recognition domain-containing protein [Bariatricus sp.]|nr:nucleoside recognition domain-containing protein [Bariatricus sp.]
MKRMMTALFLITLFILMLAFPSPVLSGGRYGLLLWFHTVLPTLFPFMVLTGLLANTSALFLVSELLHPVTGKLFRISPNASLAVMTGFLCGYPMGAKVTADLVKNEQITYSEGEYLLSFCNNTSPMFVISYIFTQILRRTDLALLSLGILILSSVICSFLFRKYYKDKSRNPSKIQQKQSTSNSKSILQLLDECIIGSSEAIIKIGGYIILCSIFISLLSLIPIENILWNSMLLPSMEITSGIQMIYDSGLIFPVRYTLIMALTSFGGISAVLQTRCMTSEVGFSMTGYIIEKLITALVTSLFSFLFIWLYS